SLELFSVIGGYMGMYLGVSIVAVYDFMEKIATAVYKYFKKDQEVKRKKKVKKVVLKNLLYDDERPAGYRNQYISNDSPRYYEYREEY
ncbi:hypothetical protein NPIL_322591, partial [Nephila pilipes]